MTDARTEPDITTKTPRHQEGEEMETAKDAKTAKSPDSGLQIPPQSLAPSP